MKTYHEWTRVNASTMVRDVDGQRLTMREKDKTFTVTTAGGSLLASGKFPVAVKAASLNAFRKKQTAGKIAREAVTAVGITAEMGRGQGRSPKQVPASMRPQSPAGSELANLETHVKVLTATKLSEQRPCMNPASTIWSEGPAGETTVKAMKTRHHRNDEPVVILNKEQSA